MMILIALVLVAAAAASDQSHQTRTTYQTTSYNYQGHYHGKCSNDGIYYNNANSFVMCSNGNAYHQPCAPGSRNKDAHSYNTGSHYGTTDFCGVNLVDNGYGAHGYHATNYHTNSYQGNSHNGNGYHGDSYGHPHGHQGDSYGHPHGGYHGHAQGNGYHGNNYHHGNGYGRTAYHKSVHTNSYH